MHSAPTPWLRLLSVLRQLIPCFLLLLLFMFFFVQPLFWFAVLSVFVSFAIIQMRKESLLLYFNCHPDVL